MKRKFLLGLLVLGVFGIGTLSYSKGSGKAWGENMQTRNYEKGRDKGSKEAYYAEKMAALTNGVKTIGIEEARKKALELSTNGRIKSIELEKENGKLIYEIEIAEGYSERDVHIDAITGAVLKNLLD